MITLGIRDPERLREEMWKHGTLMATAFHWPVRLNIDGTEIFAGPQDDNPYIKVFSLLWFVRGGLATLETAKSRGNCALYLDDFPGALYMEMLSDEQVLVYCTLEGTSAAANYEEFRRAWLEAADWIRQNAPPVEPESVTNRWHEAWARWFKGHFSEESESCEYDFVDDEEQEISEARERWRN